MSLRIKLIIVAHLSCISSPAPPTVVALDGDQEIIANESESAVLSFRIDRAAPPVLVEDIRWIYSAQNFDNPFAGGVDITNFTHRTNDSRLTFSADLLTLTISNIVQARMAGEETDQGRYFFIVNHPAGVRFSYIDVTVYGMSMQGSCNYSLCMECVGYDSWIYLCTGPPLIFTEPVIQTVINNGSSAVFTCFSLAFPKHSVYWTFTNFLGERVDIISTSNVGDSLKYLVIHEVGNHRFGELTVLDVQFSDRGMYNCTAENTIGSETRGANLTVHGTYAYQFSAYLYILSSCVKDFPFTFSFASFHISLLMIHSHSSIREELHSWRCQPSVFCHSCLPCHWLPHSKCLVAEEWRDHC